MKPLTDYFPKKPKLSESCSQGSNNNQAIPLDEHAQVPVPLDRANRYDPSKKCEDLTGQEISDLVTHCGESETVKKENQIILNSSIDACRFMLKQGWTFHGDDDESEGSSREGHFLGLLKFMADTNSDNFRRGWNFDSDDESEGFSDGGNFTELIMFMAKLKDNDSLRTLGWDNVKNSQMIAPRIQENIVHCFAQEIVQGILKEFEDDYFALILDESSDVSYERQMIVALRFVDCFGNVIERFIGVVHVMDTMDTPLSLKVALDNLFASLNLSLMKVRGYSYYGASNRRDEFNGLKDLIMKENQYAYYVQCFSHQLQLDLVAIAENHIDVAMFFYHISNLTKVVGASCRDNDLSRQRQAEKVSEGLKSGLMEIGEGLNLEFGVWRKEDTYWGSHLKTLSNLLCMFSSVVEVLEAVSSDAIDSSKKYQAGRLLDDLESFDFVFHLQLMLTILMITDELSLTLLRKDKDILNAIRLVNECTQRLQATRDNGWESLLEKVIDFCNENKIDCIDMSDDYVCRYESRRKNQSHVTNDFHYRVDLFYHILDQLILEINDRFNKVNSEMLVCVASLNPRDNFVDFNSSQLIKFAHFYPDDFSSIEFMALEGQLETYIMDMRSDARFSELNGLADLCSLLVKTRKHLVYPLVYRLLKFALILPIEKASVERCFSTTSIVKADLRVQECNQFLSDRFVCFIERDLLRSITKDAVTKRFQSIEVHKGLV